MRLRAKRETQLLTSFQATEKRTDVYILAGERAGLKFVSRSFEESSKFSLTLLQRGESESGLEIKQRKEVQ